jgi:universal stress protein E
MEQPTMRPIHRILVAVKDTRAKVSPPIAKAARLAKAMDASLELFHAISDPLVVDVLALQDQSLQQLEKAEQAVHVRRLESMAAPLRRAGLEVTTHAQWDHPPHEAVVRRAQRTHADLIVVERHARRHVAPWFLRFTDFELLRQSPIPVLLIKSSTEYTSPKVLAAVDPAHTFAKTAKLDEEILHTASAVSRALRGQLHVAHAYVPDILGMTPAELSMPDATARIAGNADAIARRRLESVLRATGNARLTHKRRHVLARHAVDAIPQLARELDCGIVVMGAVSRSGLKRVFIGNTAERLLDDLACDLLIVKPPAFAGRVARKSRGPHLQAMTAVSEGI